MKKHMNSLSTPMRGFSLVEVLVALVVLSIGMLGIAALYVESLRSGRSALLRSEAVMLAADMADRIRANAMAAAAAAVYAKMTDATGTITAACNLSGAGCTPAEMAAHDVALWNQVVDDRYDDPSTGRLALPGGRGTIVVDTTTLPTTYRITVSWSESGQTTANSYELRFQV